jgi:hypothetical protein
MAIEQAVTEVLDEAIQALTVLDLDKLERLEERVASLVASNDVCRSDGLNTILAKKRLLAMILQNCRSNLNVLNRLHGRNTRDQWAH